MHICKLFVGNILFIFLFSASVLNLLERIYSNAVVLNNCVITKDYIGTFFNETYADQLECDTISGMAVVYWSYSLIFFTLFVTFLRFNYLMWKPVCCNDSSNDVYLNNL